MIARQGTTSSEVTISNGLDSPGLLRYIVTNTSGTTNLVNIYRGRTLIAPKDLLLEDGDSFQDDSVFIGLRETLTIEVTGSLDYFVSIAKI